MRKFQSRAEVERAVAIGTNVTCPVPARMGTATAVDLCPEALDYFISVSFHLISQTRVPTKKVRGLSCRVSATSMKMNRGVPVMGAKGPRYMDVEARQALIVRARHDPAAFGELYDLYLSRVYSFCRKYSASREEAEDLTAETFKRALSAIAGYEYRNVPFSRWLLRIAHNVTINHARSAGRTSPLHDPESLPGDERHFDDLDEAHWLRTHVQRLPDDQQHVVRLRFYEDRSFRDVASIMGRSEGAVKQLLRRALRALHLQIQREAEEGVAGE